MNLAAAISRFVTRFPAMRGVSGGVRGIPSTRTPRRKARGALAWFAVALITLNFGAFFVIDVSGSQLRDPEYGKRVVSLKQRLAENPGRPLVLAVGSSRMSMGVRSTA